MRMPRLQVYLPDDLYEEVKSRGLPASELLQGAVRSEVRRLELLAATDRHLAALLAEVGEPTLAQQTRADDLAEKLAHGGRRQAG